MSKGSQPQSVLSINNPQTPLVVTIHHPPPVRLLLESAVHLPRSSVTLHYTCFAREFTGPFVRH
eukprot:3446948-Rhodomonas_salina.1